MKFADIPQYTKLGNYEINIFFKYFKDGIDRYISEHGLNLAPDFQRGHVWSEKQQRDYVEFILRGGNTGLIIYFNHPQWMSFHKPKENEYSEFVIVDGLQRLTALMKFLNNELAIFEGHYYKDFEDRCHIMDIKFNINNLKTKKEVLTWYLEMNSGGTPHTDAELDRVRELLKKEE